ncbi:MAG: Gfo/Idh/MocA family oxidoreductase [Spirochaetes bacterium]|nr:Gfo/Idh/MocA family oxidoreductase [Spirochaetota bacterium]
MSLNPVISLLGRRLRLAIIGGGPGSFIGAIHRIAARMDDRYQLVGACLSSKPEKAKKAGRELGLPAERSYADGIELIDKEAKQKNGAEVIAIMTPNDSHYLYSIKALESGMDVICDKPLTNSLEEAEKIYQKVTETGLVFCLTHNYTGYPMVRQAKAMVEDDQLGTIRLVQVEYVQGGNAREDKIDPEKIPWRQDQSKGGASLVMGDIGTHAHHLIRFITGIEITAVAAEAGTIVPERTFQDYAGALLHFNNGARGIFWVTQAAAGVENGLRIRVSGTKGTLEWMQETPQQLLFKPIDHPCQIYTPNGPGILAFASRASRIVAGHPEGFPEAFANIYSDAAEAIAARRCGKKAESLAMFFPKAIDGLMGVQFISKVLESSQAGSKWIKIEPYSG